MSTRTSGSIKQSALVGLGSLSFSAGLLLMIATTCFSKGNPLVWIVVGNTVASLGAALMIFAEPCARFLNAIER